MFKPNIEWQKGTILPLLSISFFFSLTLFFLFLWLCIFTCTSMLVVTSIPLNQFFFLSLLSVFFLLFFKLLSFEWTECTCTVECYLSHKDTWRWGCRSHEFRVKNWINVSGWISSSFFFFFSLARYENIATMINPFCLLSLSHNSNLPGSCTCYYVARWLIGWFSLNSNQCVSLLFSSLLSASEAVTFPSFFSRSFTSPPPFF